MTQFPRVSITDRPIQTLIGPVAIGMLLGAAATGLVRSADYPVRLLFTLLINRMIRQAHLNLLLLQEDRWRDIGISVGAAPIGAIILLILAVLAMLWMFPESELPPRQ